MQLTHSLLYTTVILIGCASPKAEPNLSLISVGMTKDEVTERIGRPTRMAAQDGFELFEYDAYDETNRPFVGFVKTNFRYLYVRFLSGRVESFGRKDMQGGPKSPSSKSTDNAPPGDAAGTSEKFDLAAELGKLEKLKKDGLITEDEYKQLRSHAIDKAKTN